MADIRIREATPDDVPGMARVRVDTWRSAYRGVVAEEHLASLSYAQTEQRWRTRFFEQRQPGVFVYVAEGEQGEIVGFALGGPELGQDPVYWGEIYALYVLPSYQNRGIGRKLVAACTAQLLRQGIETLLIWALAANPHRRFYEALGGQVVREQDKEIGGQILREVGYGWEDIRGLADVRPPE
jgi:ribosomal protein S18 acetylase RimI-like enzyme